MIFFCKMTLHLSHTFLLSITVFQLDKELPLLATVNHHSLSSVWCLIVTASTRLRYTTKTTTVTVIIWVDISKLLYTKKKQLCFLNASSHYEAFRLRSTQTLKLHKQHCLVAKHPQQRKHALRLTGPIWKCVTISYIRYAMRSHSQSKCTAAEATMLQVTQPYSTAAKLMIWQQLLGGSRRAPQSALSSPFSAHPRLIAATTVLYMVSQAWRSGAV